MAAAAGFSLAVHCLCSSSVHLVESIKRFYSNTFLKSSRDWIWWPGLPEREDNWRERKSLQTTCIFLRQDSVTQACKSNTAQHAWTVRFKLAKEKPPERECARPEVADESTWQNSSGSWLRPTKCTWKLSCRVAVYLKRLSTGRLGQ